MSTEFGKRLKLARLHAGLTQKQLAAKTGLAQSTIAELERSGFGSSHTTKIASVCGVSPAWLADENGPMTGADTGNEVDAPAFSRGVKEPGAQYPVNVAQANVGTRRIPVIDYVQAGGMTAVADPHAIGDASEWLLTDMELSGSAFALEIKGDSMLPEFKPGDRIVVDPAVQPQPGDYVVAKNGEDEATFKKYRLRGINERGDMVFELVPLNENFAVIRSDLVPTRIVGTMVEHRRYRRRA